MQHHQVDERGDGGRPADDVFLANSGSGVVLELAVGASRLTTVDRNPDGAVEDVALDAAGDVFTFSASGRGRRLTEIPAGGGPAEFFGPIIAPPSHDSLAVAPAPTPVAISPAGKVFIGRVVGTSSGVVVFTVTDTGTANINVGAVSVTGSAFAINFDGCQGTMIVPGQGCTIGVTFAPTAAQEESGTLQVQESAASSPYTVGLSGLGVAAS